MKTLDREDFGAFVAIETNELDFDSMDALYSFDFLLFITIELHMQRYGGDHAIAYESGRKIGTQ